jgi:asparagine synthase (glutamine-hydrolysing)
MCGISGVVSLSPDVVLRTEDVARMNASIAHRGPDDEGLVDLGGAILAMRRLSIIDLSGGHQPLLNESGDVALVCNGEIYNFVELRAALEGRGHRFSSRSDAETLLHLYEEFGLDFLEQVDGMFAFALWDAKRRRLVLGRDRMGEKPLHYSVVDGVLIFGSEIKAILAHPAVKARPDWRAIRLYLRHNYVPSPRTAWEGVHELPPAHIAVIENGSCSVRPYWHWPETPDVQDEPRELIAARLDTLLSRSVEIRLRSDVPVGLFLSGGIDSSLVAALAMRRSSQAEVPSFGLSFPGSKWDESPQQREAALKIGTVHHDVPMTESGFLDLYHTALRHFDEPFGDTSMLSTFVLSKYAAEHVKVVLTGDGGDELFAGYDHYLGIAGRPPAVDRFPTMWEVWSNADLASLVDGDLAACGEPEDPVDSMFKLVHGRSSLEQALAFDRRSLLGDNNLVKPDRAGMAHGLEARCPLLSHHLAEFVAGLPGDVLLEGGRTKSLLRDMVNPLYQPGFFDRPKGMFTVPFGDWLRTSLRTDGEELVGALVDRGLVQGDKALALFREHVSGYANNTRRLRVLVVLEIWLRACVDPRT